MITKCLACIAIGFTLVALLGSQAPGDRLRSAVSRSFTDNANELGAQQSAVSDRPGDMLNSDGTMFGVTLRRTRVYDAKGLQEPKSILWKTPKLFTINPGEGAPSFPIYHGAGSIIFDRRDWKAKWEVGKKGYYGYGTAPAVADGMIYFGGAKFIIEPIVGPFDNTRRKGSVFAVDALTGTQKWVFAINGSPTPIAVADGVIYFGDDDRRIFAVNAKDGQKIWQFKASHNVRIPAIMEGRAFFSDDGGNLYAADLKNGKAVWKAAKKNKVATALVAYNKLVYYGGRDNSLYAVDALTGEEKWVYRTTKPCPAPVAANGAIYVACQDSTLLAIDAESGQERWKYKTPRPLWSHPVIGNGVIYYLGEEGVMYALGSS